MTSALPPVSLSEEAFSSLEQELDCEVNTALEKIKNTGNKELQKRRLTLLRVHAVVLTHMRQLQSMQGYGQVIRTLATEMRSKIHVFSEQVEQEAASFRDKNQKEVSQLASQILKLHEAKRLLLPPLYPQTEEEPLLQEKKRPSLMQRLAKDIPPSQEAEHHPTVGGVAADATATGIVHKIPLPTPIGTALYGIVKHQETEAPITNGIAHAVCDHLVELVCEGLLEVGGAEAVLGEATLLRLLPHGSTKIAILTMVTAHTARIAADAAKASLPDDPHAQVGRPPGLHTPDNLDWTSEELRTLATALSLPSHVLDTLHHAIAHGLTAIDRFATTHTEPSQQ